MNDQPARTIAAATAHTQSFYADPVEHQLASDPTSAANQRSRCALHIRAPIGHLPARPGITAVVQNLCIALIEHPHHEHGARASHMPPALDSFSAAPSTWQTSMASQQLPAPDRQEHGPFTLRFEVPTHHNISISMRSYKMSSRPQSLSLQPAFKRRSAWHVPHSLALGSTRLFRKRRYILHLQRYSRARKSVA